MRVFMVAICLYMIWGHSANAQSNSANVKNNNVNYQNTIATPISKTDDSHNKKLSISLDLALDSNLRDTTDASFESNTTLEINPSYKIFTKATLSALFEIEQKNYADQETSISNTLLTLTRDPIQIADDLDLTSSTFGLAPTNEKDRLDNTLRGGAGVALGLIKKYSLFGQTGSTGYTLSYLQNFHEFERTNTNESNLKNRIRHILSFSQNLSEKISLSVLGRYQTGWTYQNALKTSFLITEEISLGINDSFSIYVSHTNNGDALKANGIDSDISVYDGGNSSFATGLKLIY